MRLRCIATLAATAAISLGAAACGDDEETTTGGGSGAASSEQATTPEPVANIDRLAGQNTAVTLDSGFVSALEQLELTPGAVGEAKLEGGAATFPVTGGNVTYYEPGSVSPFVQGTITHDGGLSLTGGDTTVELTDFVIDPGASTLTGTVSVNGEQAAADAELFFLDGRTLQPLKTNQDGNAVLEGTTVKLKESAAQLLNDTFGVDALAGGLKIGTAEITLEPAA